MNRRQLLQSLVLSTGACAVGAFAAAPEPAAPASEEQTSWPYRTLDPERTANLAYQLHIQKSSCMYGVFASIVNQLADEVGGPYRTFPCDMMVYGEGGVADWGTLCGTLNGGAAVISLLVRKPAERRALIDELFQWYQSTKLPAFVPAKTSFSGTLPAVEPGSVLCHPSATGWVKHAKVSYYGPERKERCHRLSADTARKTAELLNRSFNGIAGKPFHPGETTSGCLSCHGKDGVQADVRAKSCVGCHFPSVTKHP